MKNLKAIGIFLIISFISIYAGDGKKYGKGVTLKQKTGISEILQKPDSFVGKKVLIEGTVVGVCEKMGCWIEVAGNNPGEKIKVKVDDGKIVFPLEVKGKQALVEGEVYSFTVDNKASECDKETKKDGDKSCCSKENKQKHIYQIKGIGAIIK